MSLRTKNPDQTPHRLNVDDVLEARFGDHWLFWRVIQVVDIDDSTQSVVCSWPGQGSVRVRWESTKLGRFGTHRNTTFFFAEHGNVSPGDVWTHYNGRDYRVLFITNIDIPNPDHPPDVVYESVNEPKHKWSRPLSDWSRSFKRRKA